MTPDGWKRRHVRDFGTRSKIINVDGADLPPLSITKGRGVVLQSDKYKKQIATDLRKYVLARRDQFAFDPMSLYYGAIGQVTLEAGLVSPDYVVFDVDQTVNKRFMNYLLRHSEQVALYESVAETGNSFGKRRRVYWSVFADLEFTLPPLEEQRKIAAILAALDDAIEGTQAVIDQLQVVRMATLAELLTRGLPGRHMRFKQTEVGEIPEVWDVRRLGEIALVFNGKASGVGGKWLRVFKTKHVYDGMVRLDKPEFASDEIAAKVRRETYLVRDDVLTPNMAHGTIGRVSFVPDVEGDWATDGQVMVLRANGSSIFGRILFEWLSLPRGRQFLLDLEKGGAFDTLRGQTHIYPRDVKEIPVPIPGVQEQGAIAELAASFDEPLATNQECLRVLQQIKHGLMSQLLTGELRVTPDEATP